jgi:hypothetical protein
MYLHIATPGAKGKKRWEKRRRKGEKVSGLFYSIEVFAVGKYFERYICHLVVLELIPFVRFLNLKREGK